MRRVSTSLACAAAFAFFQVATAPNAYADSILGTAANFAVLGGSETTNTGPTTLTGDYGVSTGSSLGLVGVTIIDGAPHANDGVAALAQSDLTNAYGILQGLDSEVLTGNLGGKILTSGVYSYATDADLTGTLTLNAEGADFAFFVFQIGTNLNTASGPGGAAVKITNAGDNVAIFWVVGSATIGTFTEFQGNILGLSAIVLKTSATIGCGSALNQIPGPVTMDSNTVSIGCNGLLIDTEGEVVAGDSTGTPTPVPEPGTLALLGTGIAGLVARRRRSAGKA